MNYYNVSNSSTSSDIENLLFFFVGFSEDITPHSLFCAVSFLSSETSLTILLSTCGDLGSFESISFLSDFVSFISFSARFVLVCSAITLAKSSASCSTSCSTN